MKVPVAPPGSPAWWALPAALALAIGWLALEQGAADLGSPMGKAVSGGFVAAAATALGALPAVLIQRLSARAEHGMLGFGAGVMAAASCFSLILPGIEAASGLLSARALGAAWVAIGVGFSGNDNAVGVPLTAAIAVQDVPEGLVVAVALRTAAYGPGAAVLMAALTGLAEPVGAVIGSVVTSGLELLYPFGLGFAAGAMIWVVSHEIIPETHRKGHEQAASVGLLGGFIVMMMLDTAFA